MSVTNLVVCLKIVTTMAVPVSCPDGVEGCCVLHMANKVVSTEYEEVKLSEDDLPNRGIGYLVDDICVPAREMIECARLWGCTNNCAYPIRVYDYVDGRRVLSHNAIGVFWPNRVEDAVRYFDSKKGVK